MTSKPILGQHFLIVNCVFAAISLIAIVLVPVWSVDIPPLQDYHNHLARQYILANLQDNEDLRRFYQSEWSATPYLAMDAVVQTLASFMSVQISGKIFLSLTLLLLGLAPIALNLALFRQVTPFALLGLVFVHNHTVSLGFMPYLFSIGFALCLLSLWISLRASRPWVRLAMFPVLSSLLFFSHLMGFVIYALTVSAYELGCHIRQNRGRILESLALDFSQRLSLISLCLQFLVPLAIFLLFGPSTETTEQVRQTTYGGIQRKFDLLVGIFSYLIPPYSWTIDKTLVVVLPVALFLLVATRRLEIAKEMLWPLIAVLILFFAMPFQWLGGWGGDHRLLLALGLLFVGSLFPKTNTGERRTLVIGLIVIVVLIMMRAMFVTVEWRRADHDYAEYLSSFALLEKGSKVYYAFGHAGHYVQGRRPKYFIPCLAVATKQVYVPFLFTSASVPGIPLRYTPAYERLQHVGGTPFLQYGQSPPWGAIMDKYDYFILGNERFFDTPVPERLVAVYKGKDFTIYKNPLN